jgi:hypothetical protein
MSERGAATVAAPSIRGESVTRPQLILHRLFAMDVDLSRCRHGGGTASSGVLVASVAHGSRWCHNGTTVSSGVVPKARESSSRCNILASSELPSIVRRGSRVCNRAIRKNGTDRACLASCGPVVSHELMGFCEFKRLLGCVRIWRCRPRTHTSPRHLFRERAPVRSAEPSDHLISVRRHHKVGRFRQCQP